MACSLKQQYLNSLKHVFVTSNKEETKKLKSERNVLDLKRQVWSPAGEPRASTHLLNRYVTEALVAVQKAETVVITGSAPTWLYLAVAHALAINGHCKQLIYNAPSSGDVEIFDYGGKET